MSAVTQLPLEWRALFNIEELNAVLEVVTANDDHTPKSIFEAFKYTLPQNICCVVIGQDPYPAIGTADGLCFSSALGVNGTPGVTGAPATPASLINIFRCLEKSGLRKNRKHNSPDLHSWASQGVLMLNTALTTRVGEIKAHSSLWRPIIKTFIEKFCKFRAGSNIPFLMWGNDAQKYEPIVVEYSHYPLCWTHPSPIIDNKLDENKKFRSCTHFTDVNNRLIRNGLRRIIWDNQAPCIALTDGACIANGKSTARASFSAIIAGGHFNPSIIRAEIYPNEYKYDAVIGAVVPNLAVRVTPSNNRGELLGIIYALNYFINERVYGCVEIISDSNISINTLKDWLPARIANCTEHELKNIDLVMIAWNLLNRLKRQAANVKLTHCKAHQLLPINNSARERFIHMGNELADHHAGEMLKQHPSVDSKQIEILQLAI